MVLFVIAAMVGASLTAVTVVAKTVVELSDPSLTVSVMFDTPLAFATGEMETVQFGAVPPIVIPALAITDVFDEVADTLVAQLKVLSTSVMVNATAESVVSSGVD